MVVANKVEVPKVYGALAKILGALSVDKNGTLPSNMSSKPYVTAADLNSEIKRQFVENNLILLPVERETHKEVLVDSNQKKTIAISIEGTYTIVHTGDGSSVVVGGVGDGLATGTAVSANIASTNALKNALLRTFLVTEQSTEDAAKNGVPDVGPAKESAPTEPRKETAADVKADLTTLLNTKVASEIVAKGNEFFKTENAAEWKEDIAKLQTWRNHLSTGEVK